MLGGFLLMGCPELGGAIEGAGGMFERTGGRSTRVGSSRLGPRLP